MHRGPVLVRGRAGWPAAVDAVAGFQLLSERYEAERKRIEAIGIQTFYSIVSESLNDT